MRKLLIILSFSPMIGFGQEIVKGDKIAFVSKNGDKVILNLDGTWEFLMPKDKKSISELLLNNLSLGVNLGVSEFQGDISQDGFINYTNINFLYNFRLTKKINPIFSISSEIVFGDLNGSRKNEDYLISEPGAYDPYNLYEEIGEEFTADIFEVDLITSINLESVLRRYYPRYKDNNDLDIYYNIGLGILSFRSIKRNIESDTYIYGFGYQDVEGEHENAKSFFERPMARAICYGYSASFSLTSTIKVTLLFLTRLTDTDFLDASLISQQNDKYRNISLGLDYTF